MSIVDKLNQMKSSVESLMKWQRENSMTMVNREAHYQALSTVNNHIIKYVANLVADMKNEEIKHVPIAGKELMIRKIMADMYSGHVRDGSSIVHQFDRITVPQLAGQLQSLLELYDPAKLTEEKATPTELIVQKLKPLAEQAENGMVSQLLNLLASQPAATETPKMEQPLDLAKEVQEIIAEANFITEEAKRRMQVVDPRAEILDLKERVEAMLARVESLVSANAPTSRETDRFHDTLHTMQQKHNQLVDRAQIELRILDDRIAELTEKVKSASGEKTITITVK